MSPPALRAEGLGKRYDLGLTHAGTLSGVARRWTRRLRGLPPDEHSVDADGRSAEGGSGSFWALKDVDFEVTPGEVVGIVGRNGAGKSTLLKILSRVTAPTTGTVQIEGRVGSLLEVGTGFHPELTGRENVYMNATLLGMSKREVDAKLDEIVAFSGVEKFLDTPVKRYSSGMKVRLGFAVAAHLEPELLIVDEVLAVGDSDFQKKCLGRMKTVAGEGRTVLFVSHNMGAISILCSRAVLLREGRIVNDGDVMEVVQDYFDGPERKVALAERTDRLSEGGFRLTAVSMRPTDDPSRDVLACGETVVLRLSYQAGDDGALLDRVGAGVAVSAADGRYLTGFYTATSPAETLERLPPRGELVCTIPRLPLMPGRYRLKISIGAPGSGQDTIEDAYEFDVVDGDFFGYGRPFPIQQRAGVLTPHEWSFAPAEEAAAPAIVNRAA
ncbi:ABC transporter ATP-binding protein [Alienimonas californiensis]|uniref:Teichoic acids export ATP-binding protein TagH n=1 Tax=Alienimonas californiensis TaxID=2527989 RepID=A0A517P846_9PLAN|nr:ABC transporter ATP-binding protein [Alienimonas californiensis]QDT15548.1 Teichoic acids export ATP-binding protein TagH [Alienimonas californiensis]